MLPDTMKAFLLTGIGGFDCLDYRTDVPVPIPGEQDVLVRIGAAGINNTDINTRTAWYSKAVTEGTTATGGAAGFAGARAEDSGWTGKPPIFPRIQGADACGIIVSVGAEVDPGRIGERVLIEPTFQTTGKPWPEGAIYFGSECDGAFAEYAVAPSVHAHAITSSLSDAELASFPCAYSVAETMVQRAGIRSGQSVLVTGASGGVGSAAVQLARRRGADVIAVAGAAKRDLVASLGANRVVSREANLIAEIGREKVDVVIDIVGGAQFPALLEILKRGGRYATAGAIAGPTVELDLRTLYLKDISLFGCTVAEGPVFADLVGYIERGEIRSVVAATYPLSQLIAAQTEFLTRQHTGKLVVIPGK